MFDEQQTQQPEYYGGYNAGADIFSAPVDKYGSSFKDLTDPKDALYAFELKLRRLRVVNGELKKIGGEKSWLPMMNEEGINDVLGIIVSVINQMNTLSNLDDKSMKYLHDNMKWAIARTLTINRAKYGLDRRDRENVMAASLSFCFGFIHRPFEEGERKFWKGSVVETRHTTEGNKQKFSLNPFSIGGR